MAKIQRYNGNLKSFASEARAGNRTIFSDSNTSDTLNDNITSDYLEGWTGVNIKPPMEWFNGAMYTISHTTAYLYQVGIAEYNSSQEYNKGSITNSSGVLYKSLIDNNIGNDITDTSAWTLVNPVISEYSSKTNIYGTDKLAVQNTNGDTNSVTVDLLGSAVSNQIFAIDNSTDATKIDLKQTNTSVTSYKDGLVIKFKAVNNSVNNMQIQLNNLGYKYIQNNNIGLGSWVEGDIVSIIYDSSLDLFRANDERNRIHGPLDPTGAQNLDNYVFPTNVYINVATGGPPNDPGNGFLTVRVHFEIDSDNVYYYRYHQMLYSIYSNIIYSRYRHNGDAWSPWVAHTS